MRERDLVTLAFRLHKGECMSRVWPDPGLVARLVLETVRFVPRFPFHAGVQSLVTFVMDNMIPLDECSSSRSRLLRSCWSLKPYSTTRRERGVEGSTVSKTITKTKVQADPAFFYHPCAQREETASVVRWSCTHRLKAAGLKVARLQAAGFQAAASEAVGSEAVGLKAVGLKAAKRGGQRDTAEVHHAELDEWLLAEERLAQANLDAEGLLPKHMLHMLLTMRPGALETENPGIRRVWCMLSPDAQHQLCFQVYRAPYDRKASVAQMVIAELPTDLSHSFSDTLPLHTNAYIHPTCLLTPPPGAKLTDTRAAVSFMYLLRQAMQQPREVNKWALGGASKSAAATSDKGLSPFRWEYVDEYDYIRVNKSLCFHWCLLRLPGRMSRPLQVGMWVTTHKNLDPRVANTYVVPDLF